MRTVALRLCLAAFAACGAAGPGGPDLVVGAPLREGGLTLFPLLPRRPPAASSWLTLDEAMAGGVLGVEETGADGSVNSLRVSNRSRTAVFLLAGELLLGGKQDRMVGESTVVPPLASRLAVPVWCVEHGRWQGRSLGFRSGEALGHVALRREVMFAGQDRVWREVAAANQALGTATASQTYRAAARKLEGETEAVAGRLVRALEASPGAAGVAVALGGRVVAAEWFASPELFAKLRRKLVASYAAEAVRGPAAAPDRPVGEDEVRAFLRQAAAARPARQREGGASRSVDLVGAGALGQEVRDARSPEPVQSTFFAR